MVDIYFYNIKKRLNSTARPSGTGTKYECVFKDNTSILNPILKLRLSSKPDYNYFKFDNRYYWITDIVSIDNGLWQISGRVDALATFKGHIQSTSAFVLYDSTSNTQIPDVRLAVKTDVSTYTSTANMPWSFSENTGTYLVATTGDNAEFDWTTGSYNGGARAGTGVYTIPQNQLQYLGFDADDFTAAVYAHWHEYKANLNAAKNKIFTTPPASPYLVEDMVKWAGTVLQGVGMLALSVVTDPIQMFILAAQQLIGGGNALQNVKAAYWLPFVLPGTAISAVNKPLALGTFQDSVSGLYRVDKAVITSLWLDVSIPWHFSDWRNASCTEVMLYIPMIGCISIPTSVVKGHNTIQVRISLNTYSGAMAAEVRCNGGALGTYGANVAMPILVGDSNIGLGNITNTVVNAAAENYAGAVMNGLGIMAGMSTSVGGIGGGAGTGLTDQIVCICRCHETSQDPSALIGTIGTPTHQLKTLSGSGYCQCLNAQMSGSTYTGEPDPTQTELETVNNYLNTGVYLE